MAGAEVGFPERLGGKMHSRGECTPSGLQPLQAQDAHPAESNGKGIGADAVGWAPSQSEFDL